MKQTEMMHARAGGFDLLDPVEALTLLSEGQAEAALAVREAIPAIAAGAAAMAKCLHAGGRLLYAAAGSSGLMALADALELPGTYGIAPERIVVLFAGGLGDMTRMPGGPEDDAAEGAAAVARAGIEARDCLIAVTASGATPYPVAAAEAARAAGARVIGIANNVDAVLFAHCHVGIALPTPPEVIAGSTRMGAGTAQKIALNMLSTQMAVHLGHVHDGMMVNLVADNSKLKARALRIVTAVSGASEQQARAALDACKGAVKPAILVAAGAADAKVAARLLDESGGHLRPALARLRG